jgi:regulator of protease activity HflC (stomatin/prohibitin superfamily)
MSIQNNDLQVNPQPDYGSADLNKSEDVASSFLSKILCIICPCTWCCSINVVGQTEELVVQEWGKFYGVIRSPGFHWINCWGTKITRVSTKTKNVELPITKVADKNGSPVNVGAIISFQYVDTKAAVFGVENANKYIEVQAMAVIKSIVAKYPYETKHQNEPSLRNDSSQICKELVDLLQSKAVKTGAKILSFEFNELAYAPEIASGMLVRQQAEATVAARGTIVQGAVEIAMGAVEELEKRGLKIGEDEKAKMVSNLLVVLCGESRPQPTINL